MLRKTILSWGGLGLCFVFTGSSAAGRKPARAETILTISVYNDTNVPRGTLLRAEEEAARVFRSAGIGVKWLNCASTAELQESGACRQVAFPAHLHLRIAQKPLSAKEGVLGISFLDADGIGCQADLFYERMEELKESNHASMASLLGHVAAHEVGHLLLGTNSHAATGIMQAKWTGENLAGINLAGLYFSAAESARMKERFSTGMGAGKQDPRLTEVRVGD
jgi:hypothetical protein